MVKHQMITNMSNFHPHEVVGRGSETQHQVGECFFTVALQGLGFNSKYHFSL